MNMIAYKKDKKFIYIDDNEGHHFTAIIHWDLYMKHRKDVPKLVKIFDTINDTENRHLTFINYKIKNMKRKKFIFNLNFQNFLVIDILMQNRIIKVKGVKK